MLSGQADPDVPDTVASRRENDWSRDPQSHPIHHHNLYLVTPTSTWTCNACQHSSAVEIQAMLCYHCEKCSFYVCEDCCAEVKSSLHEHPLYRIDVTQISAYDGCIWVCDNCEKEEQGNW